MNDILQRNSVSLADKMSVDLDGLEAVGGLPKLFG
jgi:hypothetical protein